MKPIWTIRLRVCFHINTQVIITQKDKIDGQEDTIESILIQTFHFYFCRLIGLSNYMEKKEETTIEHFKGRHDKMQ
jgi:hypothetical protein